MIKICSSVAQNDATIFSLVSFQVDEHLERLARDRDRKRERVLIRLKINLGVSLAKFWSIKSLQINLEHIKSPARLNSTRLGPVVVLFLEQSQVSFETKPKVHEKLTHKDGDD